MGALVIAAYAPKPGREDDLIALVRGHVATLRREGLATERPALVMRSRIDGTILEIFEWISDQAAHDAHERPAVRETWSALEDCADFRSLASLGEAARPFPHFEPLDGASS